jgi:putative transposase
MRYTAEEKMEIIQIAERSELPLKRTIKELNVSKSTFYNWYNKYLEAEREGTEPSEILYFTVVMSF